MTPAASASWPTCAARRAAASSRMRWSCCGGSPTGGHRVRPGHGRRRGHPPAALPPLLRAGGAAAGLRAAAPAATTRWAWCSSRRSRSGAGRLRAALLEDGRGGGGPAGAGLARRAGGARAAGAHRARERMPVIRQVFIARRRVVPSAFERKLYRIRKLTENRVRAQRRGPHRGSSTSRRCRAETLVYKGLLLPSQLPRLLPGPDGPGDGQRARAGALALLHQHLPHLGAGAALPAHRAQRGDQHRARQPALDGRRGARCCRARSSAAAWTRSSPSSSRARATRPSSTTCSSCSTWPGARCRTR